MYYNTVEEQAFKNFEIVLKIMEHLILTSKAGEIKIEELINIYKKLDKKEKRDNALYTCPVIGKFVYNTKVHTPISAKKIKKIAFIMRTLNLDFVNKEILENLKENSTKIYEEHFKEIYEQNETAYRNDVNAYQSMLNE